MPGVALVACERRRIYCSARSSTRNTEWRGDTVQVCAPPLRRVQACESASGHLSEIGSRDARPRRHGLCSDARRTTRVCAAHRRSRGPGDFLIGKGEGRGPTLPPGGPAPGSRAGAPLCGSFTIHNSQFTWQIHRTSTGGTRAPARGARARAVGSADRAACGTPQGHLPPRDRPPARRRRRPRGRSRGSCGSRRRGRHLTYLWEARAPW